MTAKIYIVLGILLTLAEFKVEALQCYECWFGVELDLEQISKLFGQNVYTNGQPPKEQQKWCAMGKAPQNSTVQECPGNCAVARTTDNLSRWAGCATSTVHIDSSHSIVHINKTSYEMFVCNKNKCNGTTAQKIIQSGKPKSAASSVGVSSTLMTLTGLLVFKWI